MWISGAGMWKAICSTGIKEWLTWGDTYTLSYDDIGDEIPGLLLVIAIDAVNCSKNK